MNLKTLPIIAVVAAFALAALLVGGGQMFPPSIALAQSPPSTPSSVTVTRADGALTASWDAVSGATSYHITYSSNGGASWSLAALNHPDSSITITGLIDIAPRLISWECARATSMAAVDGATLRLRRAVPTAHADRYAYAAVCAGGDGSCVALRAPTARSHRKSWDCRFRSDNQLPCHLHHRTAVKAGTPSRVSDHLDSSIHQQPYLRRGQRQNLHRGRARRQRCHGWQRVAQLRARRTVPTAHTHADPDAYAHCYRYAYTYPDADTHAYEYTHAYTYPDADEYSPSGVHKAGWQRPQSPLHNLRTTGRRLYHLQLDLEQAFRFRWNEGLCAFRVREVR